MLLGIKIFLAGRLPNQLNIDSWWTGFSKSGYCTELKTDIAEERRLHETEFVFHDGELLELLVDVFYLEVDHFPEAFKILTGHLRRALLFAVLDETGKLLEALIYQQVRLQEDNLLSNRLQRVCVSNLPSQ